MMLMLFVIWCVETGSVYNRWCNSRGRGKPKLEDKLKITRGNRFPDGNKETNLVKGLRYILKVENCGAVRN
jgi:hypothetical protein